MSIRFVVELWWSFGVVLGPAQVFGYHVLRFQEARWLGPRRDVAGCLLRQCSSHRPGLVADALA
jgi:hypothetical protein